MTGAVAAGLFEGLQLGLAAALEEDFDFLLRRLQAGLAVPGERHATLERAERLIERDGCGIVVALGMPGKADIDQVCAHEASQGIMAAQLMTSTHILEVFVHENEEEDPAKLAAVCVDRARKHARNAYWMVYEPERLTERAGQGVRQGYADAGP